MKNVSLFASAVRPQIWTDLFRSLEGISVECQIVFAGNAPNFDGITILNYEGARSWNYIRTANIKPAQCYEIARGQCTGEVVVWIADDCEFPNDIIGKAYKYWKSQNNEKLILSLQTKESGYGMPEGKLFDMDNHRFFGFQKDSPLMAPIGMMSNNFINDLGGLDRRYICGQYENDIVMRAYRYGARVEVFGGPDCYVDIDHLKKSIAIGESTDEESFLKRPFASSYKHDRMILERSWCTYDPVKAYERLKNAKEYISVSTLKEVSPIQLDMFEPYENTDILTKSQSFKGKWE